jgi:hypothetical protein
MSLPAPATKISSLMVLLLLANQRVIIVATQSPAQVMSMAMD